MTFRNEGGADHTVTFAALGFDVNIEPGGETTYTFDAPGTYEYVCKYHPPDMKGTIIVRASPGGSAPSDPPHDTLRPSSAYDHVLKGPVAPAAR